MDYTRQIGYGISALALATAFAIGSSGATAQQAPAAAADDDDVVIEEILVTARRYAENVQDTPISVNVMTSDYFDDQRIQSADDVIQLTPGATFIRFNKVQSEYNIRGINGTAEGSSVEAAVVSVIDNIPISKDFMKNPALFDMERIEVLRGPQGTSFGRNASAGLIHFL